jgi:hypothetical protein
MESYFENIENQRSNPTRYWITSAPLSTEHDQAFIACCFALGQISSAMCMWLEAGFSAYDLTHFANKVYGKHAVEYIDIAERLTSGPSRSLERAFDAIRKIRTLSAEKEGFAFKLFSIMMLCIFCIETIQNDSGVDLNSVAFHGLPESIHPSMAKYFCDSCGDCQRLMLECEQKRSLNLDELLVVFGAEDEKVSSTNGT